MNALHHSADRDQRFPCNRDSLCRSSLGILCRTHTLECLLRHAHTWHFVGHELCVYHAVERPYAGKNRNTRRLDSLVEAFEGCGIEDRTRDCELGAGFDLVLEAANLRVEILGARIHHHADVKRGRRTDTLPADVESVIEPSN